MLGNQRRQGNRRDVQQTSEGPGSEGPGSLGTWGLMGAGGGGSREPEIIFLPQARVPDIPAVAWAQLSLPVVPRDWHCRCQLSQARAQGLHSPKLSATRGPVLQGWCRLPLPLSATSCPRHVSSPVPLNKSRPLC